MVSLGRQREGCREKGVDESSTTPMATSEMRQHEPPTTEPFSHKTPATSDSHLPGTLAPGASVFGSSSGMSEQSQGQGSSFFQLVSTKTPGHEWHAARSARITTDKVDALWAEMHASLQESELSLNRCTHFFGPDHDRRLAELRSAQIEMAQAWSRSQVDEDIEKTHRDDLLALRGDGTRVPKDASADASRIESGEAADAARGNLGADNVQPSSSNSSGEADHSGTKMEEEAEEDIKLARKRREANDEYFQKVLATASLV